MPDVRKAILRICEELEKLGIQYAVGGSYASSVHGIARGTQDLDIVAVITAEQAEVLAAKIRGEFYVDADEIKDAIRHARSFNVIHVATAFKIDIFPASAHPLGHQELMRCRKASTPLLGEEPVELPVISPEDTILVKLRWYRDGGETSERQWNDVRNVVMVQQAKFDSVYLRDWAARLGVSDLLEKLLDELLGGDRE